jgi:asparagine synthase (glutamine-hydrolysing)
LIAEFARREVTVALSGEGGDEIFCGYPRYWSNIGARSNLLNRTLAGVLPPLSRFGSSMQRRASVGLPAFAVALGGLAGSQVDALLTDGWQERGYDYLWFYRQFWHPELDPLVQLRWLDLNTDLADGLLTKVDRTSMAHSLEVRPPLLDHRLVEFMLSVDPRLLAAPAAGTLESPEVRLWSAGASVAAAPPGHIAGRRGAPHGARRVAASGGQRVSPGLVFVGTRSLVHRV